MISELWESVVEETRLPAGEESTYFKRTGIMPTAYDERRRHRRFYYRRPAVLRVGDVEPILLGAYCRDISRNGMGLLSPRQMLPQQQGRLIISESQWYDLRVRWCRRLGEQCYHIGCDFDTQEFGGPSLW